MLYEVITVVTGSGGYIKQAEGRAEGISTRSPEEELADYQAYAREMMTPGNMVSIAIPLVEYGFSGPVNNASYNFV